MKWGMVLLFFLASMVEGLKKPAMNVPVNSENPTQEITDGLIIPGNCKNKDYVPVDLEENWKDSCRDNEGNSYSEESFLMSCCGCFRYVCTMSQVYPFTPSFNWTKEVS